MILVDSTVWIDHFKGRPSPQVSILHACLGVRELGIGDLILCEVLQVDPFERELGLRVTRA